MARQNPKMVETVQSQIRQQCGPNTLTSRGIAKAFGCTQEIAWEALEGLVTTGEVVRNDKGWRLLEVMPEDEGGT